MVATFLLDKDRITVVLTFSWVTLVQNQYNATSEISVFLDTSDKFRRSHVI